MPNCNYVLRILEREGIIQHEELLPAEVNKIDTVNFLDYGSGNQKQ